MRQGIAENDPVIPQLHVAFGGCLGSITWSVPTRPDVAVYIQALQRCSAAPGVVDRQGTNLVIRHLRRHKPGLQAVKVSHPLRLVRFTGAACKALLDEHTGLALRAFAAACTEDNDRSCPQSSDFVASLLDFTMRRQRRVVRNSFAAKLDGLVDSIERLLLLQATLCQIFCGTGQSGQILVDFLEHGKLYPSIDVCVDARVVFDA